MWMIQILEDGEVVVFRVSGRLEREQLVELEKVLESRAACGTVELDLGGVKIVDRDAVSFLAQRERDGVRLKNCPGYIREWINKEKNWK